MIKGICFLFIFLIFNANFSLAKNSNELYKKIDLFSEVLDKVSLNAFK